MMLSNFEAPEKKHLPQVPESIYAKYEYKKLGNSDYSSWILTARMKPFDGAVEYVPEKLLREAKAEVWEEAYTLIGSEHYINSEQFVILASKLKSKAAELRKGGV
jgi:hypothetical protein